MLIIRLFPPFLDLTENDYVIVFPGFTGFVGALLEISLVIKMTKGKELI